jgi:hypothetical protein
MHNHFAALLEEVLRLEGVVRIGWAVPLAQERQRRILNHIAYLRPVVVDVEVRIILDIVFDAGIGGERPGNRPFADVASGLGRSRVGRRGAEGNPREG